MSLADYVDLVQASVNQNNQWSAQQAANQMKFQERMSSTAHQREVADLKAAGLNPVLSAHSNGAASPSGAMGTTDTSGTSALVEILKEFSEGIANSASYGASLGYARGSAYDSDTAVAASREPGVTRISDSKKNSKFSSFLDSSLEKADEYANLLPYKYKSPAKAAVKAAKDVKSVIDKYADDIVVSAMKLAERQRQKTRVKAQAAYKDFKDNPFKYW